MRDAWLLDKRPIQRGAVTKEPGKEALIVMIFNLQLEAWTFQKVKAKVLMRRICQEESKRKVYVSWERPWMWVLKVLFCSYIILQRLYLIDVVAV